MLGLYSPFGVKQGNVQILLFSRQLPDDWTVMNESADAHAYDSCEVVIAQKKNSPHFAVTLLISPISMAEKMSFNFYSNKNEH